MLAEPSQHVVPQRLCLLPEVAHVADGPYALLTGWMSTLLTVVLL